MLTFTRKDGGFNLGLAAVFGVGQFIADFPIWWLLKRDEGFGIEEALSRGSFKCVFLFAVAAAIHSSVRAIRKRRSRGI